MLRIITDTGSDFTIEEARERELTLIPLTVLFGEEHFPCLTKEDRDAFYERMLSAKELPTTSQPAPALYLAEYEKAKEAGDEVLVLTLSEGLSGTYQSACIAKEMAEYDAITVVDTGSVILGQRMIVERACQMRDAGKSRQEIEEMVLGVRDRMVVCGAVESLDYLRKGGRIPAPLALIGAALKIKPALIIQKGVIESLSKSRGMKQAIATIYETMDQRKRDESWPVSFGYVYDKKVGEEFQKESCKRYGLTEAPLYPVGPSIGVHVGPGCLVYAFVAVE